VLSVDEKTQIQALDRTAPMLPMKRGRSSATPTTTNTTAPRASFAALEVATGKVTTQATCPPHRS